NRRQKMNFHHFGILRRYVIYPAAFLVLASVVACLGPEKAPTEITDPSLVTAHFLISNGRSGNVASGTVKEGDYVFIADILNGAGKNLEIQNGGVSVNGVPLGAARRVGGGPGAYYDEGNINYVFD